jgi:hypothetical protein
LTSAQEQTHRQLEKGGLDVLTSVLSFCATKDPHARHFLKVVTIFKDMIEAQEFSNFEQRVDWASGWTNLDPLESRPRLASTSTLSSEPASFESFNYPGAAPSNHLPLLDLRMYSTTSGISGPEFVDLANHSNQPSMPSALPPEYVTDPNSLLLSLNGSHHVSFDDSMNVSMDGNPGQMGMAPQHFQTFFHDFSQSQDFRIQEQSQVNAFSSA